MCVRRRFCIAISASNLSWPTGVTNSRNVAEAAKVWLLLNLDCKELEKQTWILALSSVIVLWNDDKILKPLIIVLLVMAVDCAVELMKVWSLLLRCDSFVLSFSLFFFSILVMKTSCSSEFPQTRRDVSAATVSLRTRRADESGEPKRPRPLHVPAVVLFESSWLYFPAFLWKAFEQKWAECSGMKYCSTSKSHCKGFSRERGKRSAADQ